MAKIRHYVKPHWINKIKEDGYINIERQNAWPETKQAQMAAYGWHGETPDNFTEENNKKLSEIKGDQAWFTSEWHCNTSSTAFTTIWKDCYIEFDTDDIDVQKWHYFKKTLNHPEAGNAIRYLDKTAKMVGDDPYCFWISEKPVPLDKAQKTGVFSDDFDLESVLESTK